MTLAFCLRCLAIGAALLAPSIARAGHARSWPNVDPRLNGVVAEAVASAAARLARPGCALVLGDFSDTSGTPLAARVAATGESASGYLRWITFTSAAHHPACAGSNRVAFTVPGSRVVHVCPERFERVFRDDEGYAVNAVIHEALHTLGLGENPPSSAEITNAVAVRCGRYAR